METIARHALVAAIGLGLLGGLVSHLVWLIVVGRKVEAEKKSPRTSKKSVQARIVLFLLSALLGAVAGFVIGLTGAELFKSIDSMLIAAFIGGVSFDTIVVKFIKLTNG